MEDETPSLPSDETLRVTLLSSEWKSLKGGVSTINSELAIQLAKHLNVEVYVYLPKCTEEDKKDACSHSVQLIEAEELPGFEPINWLTCLPKGHLPHCLIGHGLHLGRQIPAIKRHHDCKWVQVVHMAPEELGMYKTYEEAIFKGEQKHQAELLKLCDLADQVVAVGPKLADAYSRYLRFSSKDQDVINLTPSIFTEFLNVQQATEERRTFCVLIFGRDDGEDFMLKGYDIAAQAVSELKDSSYQLMFFGAPVGKEVAVTEKLLQHGILTSQLTVRPLKGSREDLAKLFCEVDLVIMPSRTEGPKCKAKYYLWSISCLYAAVPAILLEVSSLGSILVTPRTQDLTIRIPLFCCNVSDKESERQTIIKGMIKGVLAALQDLAVSPAIRDPRLNTAECVIEGHKTDISAIGPIRNMFITIISWSSVCFTLVSCHLLVNVFDHYRKLAEPDKESYSRATRRANEDQKRQENRENKERKEEKKEKFFAQAICTLCSLLAVIGFLILSAALAISICYCIKGELRWDFPVSIGLIFIGDILVFSWRKKALGDKKWCSVRFTICASVTSYLASWQLIGIMINPTWGLTITLLLVFFLAAFTFARYQYLNAPQNKTQVALSCVFFVLAVIFLVLPVVMAGQAYYGRETADGTLKAALLSAIGALLSWLSWKKHFKLEPANNQSAKQSSNGIEMEKLTAASGI